MHRLRDRGAGGWSLLSGVRCRRRAQSGSHLWAPPNVKSHALGHAEERRAASVTEPVFLGQAMEETVEEGKLQGMSRLQGDEEGGTKTTPWATLPRTGPPAADRTLRPRLRWVVRRCDRRRRRSRGGCGAYLRVVPPLARPQASRSGRSRRCSRRFCWRMRFSEATWRSINVSTRSSRGRPPIPRAGRSPWWIWQRTLQGFLDCHRGCGVGRCENGRIPTPT